MGQKIGRFSLGMSVMLAVSFAVTSCGTGNEPISLSDQELADVVNIVQEHGTVLESASCQVEVFRIEGSTTYGWATCAPSSEGASDTGAQVDAFPFRLDGEDLRRPDEGKNYQKDVEELFPEDLRSAINQHTTGLAK